MNKKIYGSDLEPLVQKLDFRDTHVLDVGCGNGDKARQLVKLGAQVIGIEPDLKSWQVKEIETEGFRLIRGGAQSIDLADNSADIVILMYSLHHVPEKLMATALSEIQRVLKPSGVLYIAEPIAQGSYQDVCEAFLDETQIRRQAITAIETQLKSEFSQCDEFEYVVPELFTDFDDFCTKMMAHSLNRYDSNQVNNCVVRQLFEQHKTKQHYQLDQPVRCWVFYNTDQYLLG